MWLTVKSAIVIFVDPLRSDMVSACGEVTGHHALRELHARMQADPVGQRILRERPKVRSDQIDFDYLRSLPRDSFGYTYAQFVDSNGFQPDSRPLVKYVNDVELAYVMQRYREVHDFWHVLFVVPPNIFGEVVLKYVEKAQTKLPVATLIAYGGFPKLRPVEWLWAIRLYVPWAKRAGHQSSFLMNVVYEEEFETPLEELRERLNIEVAPAFPSAK